MKPIKIRTVLIIAILIAVLLMVFLLQKHTMSSVNLVSERTALTLLADNACQVKTVLDNQIRNIWIRMEMVDNELSHIGNMTKEQASEFLRNDIRDACMIELVSGEGESFNYRGEKEYLNLKEDLYPLIFQDSRICTISQEGEQTTLLFGMPVTSVWVEQTEIRYMLVYFELDSFMKLLAVESFAGEGKIRVINSKGLCMLHTDNLAEDETSYFFFKLYESAEFIGNDGIPNHKAFRESVLNGENHAVHVKTTDQKDTIISYAGLEDPDWYVTIVVDYDSVLGTLEDRIDTIGMNSIFLTMGVVLIAVIVLLFISMDIKKVRKEKQQLEELNLSLAQAKQVTQDALQIAENANQAKSYFLSSMSHDIRTPLNAIVGFATLLENEADNPAKVQDYTKKITSASQNLLGLLSDILDMSRIESGKTTVNLSEESISDIVNEVDTIIRPQMRAKGHTFDIVVSGVVHDTIVVDRLRFIQILTNLLTNAVKYTQDNGSVRFTVSELHSSSCTAYYRITVSDNGYGMSQEYVNTIFDSFSREEDSRTSKISGTGLGMAITKKLVDLMGGTIQVDSVKGKGSTFTVDIQFQIGQMQESLQSESEERTKRDTMAEKSVMAGMHILVAEDNQINAEVLKELLKIRGASCDICENGRIVLETFERSVPGTYDLILMDVQMPEMNGYEATKAIRNSIHPQAKTIPIIAMTANAFNEDVQNALEAGMNAHVSKPMNTNTLEKAVRKLSANGKETEEPGVATRTECNVFVKEGGNDAKSNV